MPRILRVVPAAVRLLRRTGLRTDYDQGRGEALGKLAGVQQSTREARVLNS